MNNNNIKKGVNYKDKAEALSIRNKLYKASINYSREWSCVYGKHCGLPGLPGSMYRPHK